MDSTPRDRAIGLAKGLFSLLPGIGPLIAAIVLDDIPAQRADRIQDFVERLASKVADLEARLRECVPGSEAIAILEDGMVAAARAFSGEQRDRIATIVAYGLTDAARRRIEAERLLDLLEALDDEQVILLAAHSPEIRHDREFVTKHLATLSVPYVTWGTSQEVRDEATIRQIGIQRLISLSLLQVRVETHRSARLDCPGLEDVETKPNGIELTPTGHLLLRRLKMLPETTPASR